MGEALRISEKILVLGRPAKKMLSTAELQHAVAVEPGKAELNKEFIPTAVATPSSLESIITSNTTAKGQN